MRQKSNRDGLYDRLSAHLLLNISELSTACEFNRCRPWAFPGGGGSGVAGPSDRSGTRRRLGSRSPIRASERPRTGRSRDAPSSGGRLGLRGTGGRLSTPLRAIAPRSSRSSSDSASNAKKYTQSNAWDPAHLLEKDRGHHEVGLQLREPLLDHRLLLVGHQQVHRRHRRLVGHQREDPVAPRLSGQPIVVDPPAQVDKGMSASKRRSRQRPTRSSLSEGSWVGISPNPSGACRAAHSPKP
jgi:hypothetical protein